MTESARVRGQVWRPDGRPATGAVVTLTDPRGAQVGSSSTGQNGAFEVPVPADGRYLMVVAAPGHDPWVRYVTAAGVDVEMPVVLNEPAQAAGGGSFSAFGPRSEPRPAPGTQAPPAPGFEVPPPPPPGFQTPPPSAPASGFQSPPAAAPAPAPQPPYPGFSAPPEPPATHVASTPAQGFTPAEQFGADRFATEQWANEQYATPQAAGPQAASPQFASGQAAAGPVAGEPDLGRRHDETMALAAQAALNAIAEGRPLPAQSLYGLVTALLASRIDLETNPSSALARTAARIGATGGGSLPESRDAADAILAPLARQLLTDDDPRGDDAADPENVIALLRPLIEALATDLEARTAR